MNMKIDTAAIPHGLLDRVLARVALAHRRRAQLHLALYGGFALCSVLLLLPALQYASTQFAASGFFSYLSLFFSDSSVAATYWRELGLSLVDSLPSIALIAVLVPAAALVWSAVHVARGVRKGFSFA